MAAGLWQVGLWREGGHAPFSHGQFRSVFSVKLFVELNRPRPDFISILAPADASSADLDWMNAELSRAGSSSARSMRARAWRQPISAPQAPPNRPWPRRTFAPNLRNSACRGRAHGRTETFGTSSTQQHWLRAMSATFAKQFAGFARCCLELARSAKTATHRARFTQMAHEYWLASLRDSRRAFV